jgi:hypothetical protein
MANWMVFSLDDGAGRADVIEAASADAAEALVLAAHPNAITSVVPAEAMEGCNRTRMLWEWMERVLAAAGSVGGRFAHVLPTALWADP